MKKILDRIFSDRYVNHGAVVGNAVLLLMYRFAYPFAVVLNSLNLSPNQITTQSLIFSIMAFAALAFDEGWVWFAIFWGVAVLLDFCDGTVARMANKVSKSAFRYDHMSDLFKLSLVMLGVGIHYNDPSVWILAFAASFAMLYCDALNQTLGCIAKLAAKAQPHSGGSDAAPAPIDRLRDRNRIAAWIVKRDWLLAVCKNTYAALLTVNGHTLLLFFILPLGRDYARAGLFYLIFVEMLAIRSRIAMLVAMRR